MNLTYDDYIATPTGFRQRDLTPRVSYDGAYLWDRYVAIDAQVRALACRRLHVLNAFAGELVSDRLLDFGCGTGRFVQAANESQVWDAVGLDLVDGPGPRITFAEACTEKWGAVCFFDSLEHVTDPMGLIAALLPATVMISVPECHRPDDADWFLSWKHRRPGEHLWHWHRHTLRRMMLRLGYRELMVSSFEDDFRPRYDPALPNILTGIYTR